MPDPLRVLGIDPGTTRIGYGIIEQDQNQEFRALDFGILSDEPMLQSLTEGKKFVLLEKELSQLLHHWKPHVVGIEALYFGKNTSTASSVYQARGVMLYAISKLNIPYLEIHPNKMKLSITGYGKASKEQIIHMVARILAIEPRDILDDTMDALALALTTCMMYEWGKNMSELQGDFPPVSEETL